MAEQLIPEGLSLDEENRRLRKIITALMRRVEQDDSNGQQPYTHFQNAVALEDQVRRRTRDLAEALDLVRITNARLMSARAEAVKARNDLTDALDAVQEGFALFDDADFLILSNTRFCAHLPDVCQRIGPGMHFLDYVRVVAESSSLTVRPGVDRAQWAALRMESHRRQHANFVVELAGDRWLQVSEQRTPSGGTAVIQTDVTGMVRREREERDKLLDVQSRMVRATLDHISQGVCIFDAERRLIGWNHRLRQLVSPPLEMMQTGTPFEVIFQYFSRVKVLGTPERAKDLLAWINGPATRPPLSIDLERDDGMVLQLYAQATPDQGFVMSFTDLTVERHAIAAMHRANETLESRVAERTAELEAARDQAERANASKSRFVASASHDLLQPLSAAKLFLSSLARTELGLDQLRLTERIRSAFDSVEHILGALLDISKFDIGAARTDIEPLRLDQIIETVRQEFQPSAQQKGLDLRVIAPRLVVDSDRVYLRRILQNLVSNALRYTQAGRVLVGARRVGPCVRVEVWDTGPGIPNDRLEEIFCEFTRLDTSGAAGMGLGLAIVEQACALLDHPLAVRSVVGRGTVFTVTVPRSSAPWHPSAPILPEEDLAGPLENLLILTIENDPNVRAGLVKFLEDLGASVLDAAALQDAQALIADVGITPDVILADYHLDHNHNGLAAIKALRADHGPIPAVLITADRTIDVREAAETEQVILMHKPIKIMRLRLLLQQLCLARPHSPPETMIPENRGNQGFWLDPDLSG